MQRCTPPRLKGSLHLNSPRLTKKRRVILCVIAALVLIPSAMLFAQTVIAHRPGSTFTPDYPRSDLAPVLAQAELSEADYALLFCQTGLGRSAVDRLRTAGETGNAAILTTQEQFFAPVEVECTPMLGWFTREDRLRTTDGEEAYAPYLVDWQPGDILVTLSTHSLGWRHGHAGLVVETENGLATLECVVLGTDSTVMNAGHWRLYSNFAVLRVKDADESVRTACADYAMDHLLGIPYHLTAGFFGPKAQDENSPFFGLQCSYLVWYAWNAMGYDLDSDGGPLASTYDLLHSDKVEIVQLYGMDPRDWL